jgi:hypothetical protein
VILSGTILTFSVGNINAGDDSFDLEITTLEGSRS